MLGTAKEGIQPTLLLVIPAIGRRSKKQEFGRVEVAEAYAQIHMSHNCWKKPDRQFMS